MKISIIAAGSLKEKYLKNAASEYIKRLSRYSKLKITEIKDEKAPENLSDKEKDIILNKEAQSILNKTNEKSTVILLDVKGNEYTSIEFADMINNFALKGKADLTFIIGGSLGVHDIIKQKADLIISISKMTFPHQLFRIILLEQIYRAFKIINNEPYHKA